MWRVFTPNDKPMRGFHPNSFLIKQWLPYKVKLRVFNDCVSLDKGKFKRVMWDYLHKITYVREKWCRFKWELHGLNSLKTLAELGRCFMIVMNQPREMDVCQKYICGRYVSHFKKKKTNNSKHRIYWIVSKECNLSGEGSKVIPTYHVHKYWP